VDTLLLDRNVFSYIHKNDTRAQLYREHLEGNRLALCFMTVAELYQWARQRNWGRKRIDELEQKLSAYVVLHSDRETAWEYAGVRTIKGHPMNPGDAWIAAAALRHRLPLVTHDRTDFEHIPGLVVVSEA
jgi:predicted nucleic acid-binding protein